MKNKTLSLLLVVCLMFALTTAAYASNDSVSAKGNQKIKKFVLDGNVKTDYINLSASEIGDDKSVYFNVLVEQSNPSFIVGVSDNATGEIVTFKSYTTSAFAQMFPNVLEKGKSYRIFIGNWKSTELSGELTVGTY